MSDNLDTRMMARALQLAKRGQYSAMPNPHVGCVLVRDGLVVGEGFTQPAGGNHAEIEALQRAGTAARGATAYVTLEPCSHQGKTGPCASALVKAGVQRVVAAMMDPNPLVAGNGFDLLRAEGVQVESGLLETDARELIPGFIARMVRGRGRVRAKLAMSLDGRTAMASGESQWITGPAARADVQRLRAMSCAVVTGVGTVIADDCSLTVRAGELGLPALEAERASARQPLRVVLDSRLRTPAGAKVLDRAAPTLLCHARQTTVPPCHHRDCSRPAASGQLRGRPGFAWPVALPQCAAKQRNSVRMRPPFSRGFPAAGAAGRNNRVYGTGVNGQRGAAIAELAVTSHGRQGVIGHRGYA